MRSPRGTGCVQWHARRREDGSPCFSSGLAGRQAARRSSRNPMSSVSRRGVLHGGPTAAPTGTLVRARRREGGPCLCLPLECAHAQGVLPASNRSAESECSEPLFDVGPRFIRRALAARETFDARLPARFAPAGTRTQRSRDPSNARPDGVRPGRGRLPRLAAPSAELLASRIVAGGLLPGAAGSPFDNCLVAHRAGRPARAIAGLLPSNPSHPLPAGRSEPLGLRWNIGEAPIIVNPLFGRSPCPTYRLLG